VHRDDLSRTERLAARVCGPRTLVALAVLAAGWVTLNLLLARTDAGAVDPFPFRWMQRVSILVNGALVYVALQARFDARKRAVRMLRAATAMSRVTDRPRTTH
jgi:hypothetical protein